MNKVNNVGENIYVSCKNCKWFDSENMKCMNDYKNIYNPNYAEQCNSFDCDKDTDNTNETKTSNESEIVCFKAKHEIMMVTTKYKYCPDCGLKLQT